MKSNNNQKSLYIYIYIYIYIAVFLLLIFAVFAGFKGPNKNAFQNLKAKKTTLVKLTESLEGTYRTEIPLQKRWVDLNGVMARALGERFLNNVVRLKNGYLTITTNRSTDANKKADAVVALWQDLQKRGIPLLYVAAPRIYEFYQFDENVPAGFDWVDNRAAFNDFTDRLREAKVSLLDVNQWAAERGLAVEDVFFRTDHHWLPETAFEVFKTIAAYMEEHWGTQFPEELDEGFRRTTFKKGFWGSGGKRVGRYFARWDDFTLIEPLSESDIWIASLAQNTLNQELFDRFRITNENLHSQKDDIYSVYRIPNPIFYVSTPDAPNDKTLLLIGDSYGAPVRIFLSPFYRRIIALNNGARPAGNTYAELIDIYQPDEVLIVDSGMDKNFAFDIDEFNAGLQEPIEDVGQEQSLALEASNSNQNYVSFGGILKAGQTYTFTVGSSQVSEGKSPFYQLRLYNRKANKQLKTFHFFASSDEPQRWTFSVPEKEENLELLIYAGVSGKTKGIALSLTDVVLTTGVRRIGR